MKKIIYCDKCGASSEKIKIESKATYPHGRKSKPVIYRKCKKCQKSRK